MVKDISEFNLHENFPGVDQIDFADVVGKEITIEEVKPKQGGFGTYVAVRAKVAGLDNVVSFQTGSKPIVEKCLKLVELKALPVICVVVKIKNYFDLQSPKAQSK